MADLVTHGCIAFLLKAPTRRRHVAAFVAGNLLPDLLSRVPFGIAMWIHRHVHPLPLELVYGWEPLHLPVGMAVAAWALAGLFPREQRRGVGLNLLLGMLVHLAVDVTQRHLGGGYLLLWPLSLWSWELGLLDTEATVLVAPFLVPLTFLAWRFRRGSRPPRAPADPPG
jgi:hypothetical protein